MPTGLPLDGEGVTPHPLVHIAPTPRTRLLSGPRGTTLMREVDATWNGEDAAERGLGFRVVLGFDPERPRASTRHPGGVDALAAGHQALRRGVLLGGVTGVRPPVRVTRSARTRGSSSSSSSGSSSASASPSSSR